MPSLLPWQRQWQSAPDRMPRAMLHPRLDRPWKQPQAPFQGHMVIAAEERLLPCVVRKGKTARRSWGSGHAGLLPEARGLDASTFQSASLPDGDAESIL